MGNGILGLVLVLLVVSCNQKQRENVSKNQKSDILELIPDTIRVEQIAERNYGMFICWLVSTFHGQEWTPTLDKNPGSRVDTYIFPGQVSENTTNYLFFLK